jgi:hypothetical protein
MKDYIENITKTRKGNFYLGRHFKEIVLLPNPRLNFPQTNWTKNKTKQWLWELHDNCEMGVHRFRKGQTL